MLQPVLQPVLQPRQPLPQLEASRRTADIRLGRKFENNKLKMAKTALAYAKKKGFTGCCNKPLRTNQLNPPPY